MKTILVPVGGTSTDHAVFETAYVAARMFRSHLAFVHMDINVFEAARHQPHFDFAVGAGLRAVFDELDEEQEMRAATGKSNFKEFCETHAIEIVDAPAPVDSVTARWWAEAGDAMGRLLFHARRHDLIVIGRRQGPNGLPVDFTELLLLGCGRPLLIAAQKAPAALDGTVVVCWKESAEAARAITAAMPFLVRAKEVVVMTVEEGDRTTAQGLKDLARALKWHGIAARDEFIRPDAQLVFQVLMMAAAAHGADLLVTGGYGRSRTLEVIFGGFTQSVLYDATVPVFILH